MKLTATLFLRRAVLLLCPLLLGASEPPRGPDSTMRNLVPGIDVPALSGMPLCGKRHDYVEPPKLDGRRFDDCFFEAIIARDSEGRVYR